MCQRKKSTCLSFMKKRVVSHSSHHTPSAHSPPPFPPGGRKTAPDTWPLHTSLMAATGEGDEGWKRNTGRGEGGGQVKRRPCPLACSPQSITTVDSTADTNYMYVDTPICTASKCLRLHNTKSLTLYGTKEASTLHMYTASCNRYHKQHHTPQNNSVAALTLYGLWSCF